MSREHSIYTQGRLQPTEAKSSNYSGEWNLESFIKPQTGVLFEGKVLAKYRHTLTDSKNQKLRFTVLKLEFILAFKREYENDGREVAIHTGKTKKVSSGFLQSSYKEISLEESGKLTADQVRGMVTNTIPGISSRCQGNEFEFWGEEDVLETIEFYRNEPVRLKTRGNTMFIESIAKVDEKNAYISNFGGDKTTDSWTDKLMSKGKEEPKQVLAQDKMEGVADDEWD